MGEGLTYVVIANGGKRVALVRDRKTVDWREFDAPIPRTQELQWAWTKAPGGRVHCLEVIRGGK